MIDLPAREVRSADVPLVALSVGGQDERSFASADEDANSAHPRLLSVRQPQRSLPVLSIESARDRHLRGCEKRRQFPNPNAQLPKIERFGNWELEVGSWKLTPIPSQRSVLHRAGLVVAVSTGADCDERRDRCHSALRASRRVDRGGWATRQAAIQHDRDEQGDRGDFAIGSCGVIETSPPGNNGQRQRASKPQRQSDPSSLRPRRRMSHDTCHR